MATYTLRQLARASGFAPRTIRKYTQHGLVPRTTLRGPKTVFGDEHLARLKEIALVQSEGYFTLVNLTAALAARDRAKDERRAAAEKAAQAALASRASSPHLAPAAPQPAAPSAGKRWTHVDLAPGLVLLVRESASDVVAKIAQEITEKYGAS